MKRTKRLDAIEAKLNRLTDMVEAMVRPQPTAPPASSPSIRMPSAVSHGAVPSKGAPGNAAPPKPPLWSEHGYVPHQLAFHDPKRGALTKRLVGGTLTSLDASIVSDSMAQTK